MFGRNEVSASD